MGKKAPGLIMPVQAVLPSAMLLSLSEGSYSASMMAGIVLYCFVLLALVRQDVYAWFGFGCLGLLISISSPSWMPLEQIAMPFRMLMGLSLGLQGYCTLHLFERFVIPTDPLRQNHKYFVFLYVLYVAAGMSMLGIDSITWMNRIFIACYAITFPVIIFFFFQSYITSERRSAVLVLISLTVFSLSLVAQLWSRGMNLAGSTLFQGIYIQSGFSLLSLGLLVAMAERINAVHIATVKSELDIANRLEESSRFQERYRLLIENAPLAACVIQNGLFKLVNRKVREMLDLTDEEVIGMNFIDFIHPDDRNLVYTNYIRRLQNEDIPMYRFRMITARRLERWGEISGVRIEWEHNDAALTFVIDVTERKEAEEALRSSEEKYRAVVENSSEMIVISQKWIFKYLNPRSMEILGYESEALIGRNWLEYVHPEDRRAIKEFYDTNWRHDIVTRPPIYRVLHADGSFRWVESQGVGLIWEGQASTLYFITDINQRMKAQKEMERLQNMLQGIFDSMPSVLVGIDRTGRVTHWNEQAAIKTGVSQPRALGQDVDRLLPLISKPMREAFERGLPVDSSAQRINVYENGEARFYDLLMYSLEEAAGGGIVLRLDDVSDRVRLDEMLVQNEKMLSVGGLAAGMAHEINNPLGGIMQGAQNILLRIDTANEHNRQAALKCGTTIEAVNAYLEERKVHRFVQGIRDSGTRASFIVKNMLKFVRHSDARKTSVKLESMIEHALELAAQDYDLNMQYDFRYIEVYRMYAEHEEDLYCVEMEIEQVILNILKNAAQAMRGFRDDPRITIKTSYEINYAVIDIEDNGPGMDEQVKKRIFDPFFTTKETGLGTGLGLAVSYFIIVGNHGGEVNVQSIPGQGSRFVIKLPLGEAEDRPLIFV